MSPHSSSFTLKLAPGIKFLRRKASLRERSHQGKEYRVDGGDAQTEQSIQRSVWISTKWVLWFPVPSANQEPVNHPAIPLGLRRHCGKSLEDQWYSPSPHTQICSRLDIVSTVFWGPEKKDRHRHRANTRDFSGSL